jgi:hypothetical protein
MLRRRNIYPSRAPEFTPGFLSVSLLLIFLVFCAVILCVFTFWVPCFDVRSDLKEKTMFGSSLSPVVHRMAYVLFAFSLCLCALVVSITYRVVFWLCFSSSSVPYIASFSGFPFLITPSVFSNVYFLKD